MQFCVLAGAIAELVSIPSFFSTIPAILQAVCALVALKYSAHRGPRPKGPLQAAFKSAPGRFVTPVTYLYKFLGMK
ncbi:hypothetical protein C5E23_12520 [Pectobacterium parmentieri]|nr:hypothetical protein C5E25_12570 [Pectobacterium parmentieri]AYH14939.1 hypothetical protein C5E23_12520 [Pectobacterium parmentieri]AYH23640.1 hypothetical protein C5E21_12530 [Pectobacterium parmentieri]RKO80423.1 hypothetical protein C5E04_14240 [Pectobacterium parmentieri]